MEGILNKYKKFLDKGKTICGEQLAEIIREVSSNALDEEFVFRYLDYVKIDENGEIQEWDLGYPDGYRKYGLNDNGELVEEPYGPKQTKRIASESRKMKITREGSENNPRFKMMETGGIYQEIERMYGVKVAKMLRQYCELKNIDPDVVVNDTSTDRNGMCAWDKFDVWAKSKGVDFAAGFGNVDVDDLLGVGKKRKSGRRATRIYDRPSDSDIYAEGMGSNPIDEQFIQDWIAEELQECEWVDGKVISGGDFILVKTQDGNRYYVTVEPM